MAYERRNTALARLTSTGAIRARQRWVQETFWKLAGGAPERTPLNVRTLGSFERKGYRSEQIVYESRPAFVIPANLYIPAAGKPPFAGVLFQMGHSLNGKAAEPYQKCCQGMARLGYVVLAFDPMGQGERTYYPKPGGVLTRLGSADTEHTLPGRQLLLSGDTATRLQVWDAVRSMDVLAAHPLVDPKRLATTGQSGGGTLTMLLAAVDDRLAAAAVSCGNTENFACGGFNPPGSTDDAEQNLLASGELGFDRWDLLYPLAPKPLLILASARDFFGTYSPRYLASGREEFGKLKRIYEQLGAAERIEWGETPAPHALSYYLRTRIYAFFDRWLQGKTNVELAEPPVQVEEDQTLWVGKTGNVVRDFGSKTPLELARSATPPKPATPPRPTDLERILARDRNTSALAVEVSRVPSEGCDLAALEVACAPGVVAPGWLFVPHRKDPSKPLLLVVEPSGRTAQWAEGRLYHALAGLGVTVCAIDVRGTGDLAPEAGRGNPRHAISHASDEAYAWASLMLGKPLAGQRVTDLIAWARALRAFPETRQKRIVLAASGHLAVPALFAAALEPEISMAFLSSGLASFRDLLETEEYVQPTANFLPGVLNVLDLPDAAAMAAPRTVRLMRPMGGDGKPADPARVRSLYSGSTNVVVMADAGWDAETLGSL